MGILDFINFFLPENWIFVNKLDKFYNKSAIFSPQWHQKLKSHGKLSIDDKISIINESKKAGFHQTSMVQKYGVTPSCISRILKSQKEEGRPSYQRGQKAIQNY